MQENDAEQPDQPPAAGEERQPEKQPQYDDQLDETAADSFPASDPPSWTSSTATRNPEDA